MGRERIRSVILLSLLLSTLPLAMLISDSRERPLVVEYWRRDFGLRTCYFFFFSSPCEAPYPRSVYRSRDASIKRRSISVDVIGVLIVISIYPNIEVAIARIN